MHTDILKTCVDKVHIKQVCDAVINTSMLALFGKVHTTAKTTRTSCAHSPHPGSLYAS